MSNSARNYARLEPLRAFQGIMDAFWDPDAKYFFTYSDHQIHPEHAHGPQGGLYTDYWWEAQLWEMAMDVYEQTGAEAHRQLIYDILDGFETQYPDFRDNDWNDDMGWWSRGAVRAYELLGDRRFLDKAVEIYDYIVQYEDDTWGGGIWWKNVDIGNGDKNEKNVATNATAVYIAMRLYHITGDGTYFATAKRIMDWLMERFYHEGGYISDHIAYDDEMIFWDWTYNFGNYAGACAELYLATNEGIYLDQAKHAIGWVTDNMTSAGTYLYEGQDDTGGFKAILTRNIKLLVDKLGLFQYSPVLTDNARQAWNHLNSSFVGWYDWTGNAPELEEQAVQSLAASATVAIIFQAVNAVRLVEGNRKYEAENAVRSGVSSEKSFAGFSGREYIAGWISDGSYVRFHVNLIQEGAYHVRFRYAGAAGDAIRRLTVNNDAGRNITFAGTQNWDNWTDHQETMPLRTGYNLIELSFDTATGSANYLNLDFIELTLQL